MGADIGTGEQPVMAAGMPTANAAGTVAAGTVAALLMRAMDRQQGS